jgi:hypothetical protein
MRPRGASNAGEGLQSICFIYTHVSNLGRHFRAGKDALPDKMRSREIGS